MEYQKTIEKVPTYALCYIINGDVDGITDEDAQAIDQWLEEWKIDIVSPVTDKDGEWHPYFSAYPVFGRLATEVVDCEVLMRS